MKLLTSVCVQSYIMREYLNDIYFHTKLRKKGDLLIPILKMTIEEIRINIF